MLPLESKIDQSDVAGSTRVFEQLRVERSEHERLEEQVERSERERQQEQLKVEHERCERQHSLLENDFDLDQRLPRRPY